MIPVPIAPNYLFSLWYPNFTDATTATILRDSNGTNISDVPFLVEEERLTLLNDENIYVSTMFASKAVMQIIANPFVGRICDRIGYSIPMFCGFVVTFFSTVLFAFSKSYAMLFIARAIQGIGSACASTAGFGMLAMAFPDDEERGTATSKALGGLALGVLLGPMFGGILYTVQGIELPYLLLAGVAVLDGLLQVLFLNPRMERPPKTDNHGSRGTRLKDLLKDPYVWVVLGSLMLSNIGIALVEPALPIYMLERWDSSALIQGLIFLPCSGIYLVSTTVFGKIGNVIGRWLTCMLGHFFIGFSLFLIPFMPTAGWISVPMAIMGFSIGMTDTSNFAEMPRIVDIRHTASSYGYIYALSDMAISVAFAAGPLVGGPLVTITSFKTIVFGVAFSSVLYCPVLLFNRRIKPRALEQQLLLEESPSPSVRSVSSDYCRTIA